MVEKAASLAHGELDVLVLQALVRKLLAKGVLSPDDVRAMLFDAATRLDLVGSDTDARSRPRHRRGGLVTCVPRRLINRRDSERRCTQGPRRRSAARGEA